MADEVEERQVHEKTTTTEEPDGATVERTQTVREPAAANGAQAEQK
ncbi:MAG: hypothetical protein ACREGA_00050 [Candidatus Saccharimonadales bacterium]